MYIFIWAEFTSKLFLAEKKHGPSLQSPDEIKGCKKSQKYKIKINNNIYL